MHHQYCGPLNLDRLSMQIDTVSHLIEIIAPAHHMVDEIRDAWMVHRKQVARKRVYFRLVWIVATLAIWYTFAK